jgi:hypothetical protein
VLLFAVTTRDRHFNPTLVRYPSGRIVLGKTSIAEAIYPDHVRGFAGVNRYGYLEAAVGAHVVNYQSYIVGLNDAGYIDDTTLYSMSQLQNFLPDEWRPAGRLLERRDVKQFRQKTPINTFAVTAPSVDPTSFAQIGPDQTDVFAIR